MKKLIVVLLIIILLALIGLVSLGIYIYIQIKPFLLSDNSISLNDSSSSSSGSSASTDKHPLLSKDQEDTLENFGIDPAKLPTEITPAMESCFTDKLGADRVAEIKSGQSEPGVMDFLKAQSCISQ